VQIECDDAEGCAWAVQQAQVGSFCGVCPNIGRQLLIAYAFYTRVINSDKLAILLISCGLFAQKLLCIRFLFFDKKNHAVQLSTALVKIKINIRRQKMAKEKIRIRLKSYDHTLIDQAAAKIVEIAKLQGAEIAGPIPLPTEKEIVTILRAVHKYKDSREQFEYRTHKRLIDILKPTPKMVSDLQGLELPAGVDIEVKI